jgi:hypothetical protein
MPRYRRPRSGPLLTQTADVIRIGHTENLRLLRRDNDPNRPPPTVTFEDRYVLEVGGELLELAYHGPNVTPDNIFVHAPMCHA